MDEHPTPEEMKKMREHYKKISGLDKEQLTRHVSGSLA